MSRLTFTKEDRIRTTAQYRVMSRKGKRHYSDHFVFVFQNNHLSRSRLGITVSKKVGKAVTRNRIKRTIREYFRLNRSLLAGRLDINVIARKSSGCTESAEIRKHLENCFRAIGLKAVQGND
nr:ribonuclease P protein component [Desulfosarcina alkanivorans]